MKPTVPESLAQLDPRKSGAAPTSIQVAKHVRYVVDAMADAVVEAMIPLRSGIVRGEWLGVGLASAGPMNVNKGTLEFPSNFAGWKKVPLVARLEAALVKRKVRGKVSFQNDAIAAALGEGWIGLARNRSTYAMITVGTGIGTGVILEGRPAQSRGMGSEWGHMIVDVREISKNPADAYPHEAEGLASGTGLIRRARAKGFSGESAADLARAAEKGDRLAIETFAEGSEALAALFYSLSLGFHPEIFVVSGGMLAIKDLFLPQAITLYTKLIRARNPAFTTPVKISTLGTRAGVIGAARLPRL